MQLSSTREETLPRGLVKLWQDCAQPVLLPFLVSRALALFMAVLLTWMLDAGLVHKYQYVGNAPLAPLSATFDANWYGSIATNGYSDSADVTQPQNYHFFPLYPLLMHLTGDLTGLGQVTGGYYFAGALLSHLCFFVALMLLYALTMQVWPLSAWANRTVWLMCALPWANVFSMSYTESLFLMLSVGAILAAYNARLRPSTPALAAAGLCAALATLTRPQGFIVALAAAWLMSVTPKELTLSKRVMIALVPVAPSLAAAAGFALYIAAHTHSGNLLAIQQTTTAWGQGFLFDLPRIFTLPPANPMWYLDSQATFTLGLWVVLTIWLCAQIFRLSKGRSSIFDGSTMTYGASIALIIYAAGSLLVTVLGNPMNIGWGRYMLIVFPLVWLLSALLPKGMQFNRLMIVFLAMQALFMYAVVAFQFTP